ncbi:hypothetical protein KFL_002550090 [Klebsormidium nitens]|uniref:Uncharacterized protein n=1 Tax=Klebsormidium nitens TaxID=105231 RepID=A0A1Y1I795_KLENI|nr:hypothetical protein KFL_002550090 [Klebsormidium nitens]|eukprot:GAQ85802.1 hypothetical protein KFL_002550090 [Klebsormidium nitens]
MSDAKQRPPELLVDERWDKAVDLTLRRFVYSGAAGSLAALLLFRSPSTRLATVAFSAGAGLGSAYSDAARLFEGKPSMSSSRPAVESQPVPSKEEA